MILFLIMEITDNSKTVFVEDLPDEPEPERVEYEHLKPYQFPAGVSGNPGGRPKDPIRSYLRRKFQSMTDPEIEAWIKDNKITGEFQWRQAEGNPTENKDVTIRVPQPILGGITQATPEQIEAQKQALQGEIASETVE